MSVEKQIVFSFIGLGLFLWIVLYGHILILLAIILVSLNFLVVEVLEAEAWYLRGLNWFRD